MLGVTLSHKFILNLETGISSPSYGSVPSSSIPRPEVGEGLATACLQEGVWLEVAAFFGLPWRPAHSLPTVGSVSSQDGRRGRIGQV